MFYNRIFNKKVNASPLSDSPLQKNIIPGAKDIIVIMINIIKK